MSYLYINNIPFRPANALAESLLGWTASTRAFNGSLIVQQWAFPAKTEQAWEFETLSEEEFNQLISFKDQVVDVRSEEEGHSFNFQALLTIPSQYSHSYTGTRQNISVVIQEI